MFTSAPKPSNPSSIPRQHSSNPTVRVPTREDDPQYSVSSYGMRKRDAEQAKVTQADPSADPCTYAQAENRLRGRTSHFERIGVYEVVPRPKGRKVVGSRWVSRIKCGPDGETRKIQKYKARVEAQGFAQIEGYNEIFRNHRQIRWTSSQPI